jgi:deoxyribodipyrimidine photolyase-related protein
MKSFEQLLTQNGHEVSYVESLESISAIERLIDALEQKGVKTIHFCDPTDYLLKRRINSSLSKTGLTSVVYPNPNFLTALDTGTDFFKDKKHFHQTDFYIAQRKRLNLMLDEKGGPVGGKWSFDAENRKKLPPKTVLPSIEFPASDAFVTEAIHYTEKYFGNNPGYIKPASGTYPWAWNSTASITLLNNFLKMRFPDFGTYEDAMVAKEKFLFHSILSPMMNNGLINPGFIVDQAIEHAQKNNIPINSLEGFIRQVVGWREFIRIIYEMRGSKQRTTNYWGFNRKIPPSFYNGTTGILPIDDTIKKILDTGYAHHIERLMILGNFFLLCEFDPNEVHRWFMELFIDAYDWVMVPNVYGMTQFADGGLMATKPYISGSNYIFKMSDYKKTSVPAAEVGWDMIWDGLFWQFMHKHSDFFLSNPRLGMLVRTYEKMSEAKKAAHLANAQLFLNKIDRENEKTMEQG